MGQIAVQKIQDMRKMINAKEDHCVSTGSPNGQFSVKSAWNICRKK